MKMVFFFFNFVFLILSIESSTSLASIPFSSGALDPRIYIAEEADRSAFIKSVTERSNPNDVTPEDCAGGDYGYNLLCGFYNSRLRLKELAEDDPAKKLSPEEYAALRWYSDWGYITYNSALWKLDIAELDRSEYDIKLAISAINHLPKKEQTTIRCDLVDKEGALPNSDVISAADRYQESKEFQALGFWSTSLGTSQEFIDGWIKPCRVLIHVKLKSSGALMDTVSSRAYEQEVLVRPMTRFKVLSKTHSSEEKLAFEIEVEEIE